MHKQNSAVTPIESVYKGYRFRSRLEARWAIFYDKIGLSWEYECEPVVTAAGHYLPDFVIRREGKTIYHEVKSAHRRSEFHLHSVYMAGKMAQFHDYRPKRDARLVSEGDHYEPKPPVYMANARQGALFYYTGPFSYEGGHGDDSDLHGAHSQLANTDLLDRSMAAIRKSSIFCVHINSVDAYGSIAEMGYAYARAIPISLTINKRLQDSRPGDFWFLSNMAEKTTFVETLDEAQTAHIEFIKSHTNKELLKALLTHGIADSTWLTFGDPYDMATNPQVLGYDVDGIMTICSEHRQAAQYARSYRFDRN